MNEEVLEELPDHLRDEALTVADRAEEAREEEDAEKMASRAVESIFGKIEKAEWSGPHEGPQGGTYWLNLETGEKRYQEDPPEEADEVVDPEDADADPRGPDDDEPKIRDTVWEDGHGIVPGHDLHPGDIEEGDEILIHGGVFEATDRGVFVGPDNRLKVEVEMDDGNIVTMDVDHLEGKVLVDGTDFDVSGYEIENGWDAIFANGLNKGNWGEAYEEGHVNVQQIQHGAPHVQDLDMAVEAAEQEMLKRDSPDAMDSLEAAVDRLSGDDTSPSDLIEEPEAPEGASAGFDVDEHEEWGEAVDFSEVDEATPLSQLTDVMPGVTAQNMAVMEMEGMDGDAFITEYEAGQDKQIGYGADEMYRDQIAAIHHFATQAGMEENVPPLEISEDGAYVAMKEFGGDDVEAEELDNVGYNSEWLEKVDTDDAADKFATLLCANLGDMHSQNVMVSENGEVGFHDLDHGGDKTEYTDSAKENIRGTSKAGWSYGEIVQERDYEDLPEGLQDRFTESEWESWESHYNKTAKINRFLTERAEERATELLEYFAVDDLVMTDFPDYQRFQDEYSDNITHNLRLLADNVEDPQ